MGTDLPNRVKPASPSAQAPLVPYRTYFWWLAAIWTLAIAGSLFWNHVQHRQELRGLAEKTARALLAKDLLYREWAILNGSVYVPKNRQAVSPHSADSTNDLVAPSGEVFTLLNPAIVSQHIFDIQELDSGFRGRLASLRPINPDNQADAWETQALRQFATGATEVTATVDIKGESHFRLMRPLFTVESCYRCHVERQYPEGQVRGGISLTVPWAKVATAGEATRHTLAHLGLWIVGLAGIAGGTNHLKRQVRARQRVEAERELLIAELQEALANVKTLRGLIPICASCKRIRDDRGFWTRIEQYLEEHSDAEFSHGLCVECVRKLYPDISDKIEARLRDNEVKAEAEKSSAGPSA
jgi:hypothetical protein